MVRCWCAYLFVEALVIGLEGVVRVLERVKGSDWDGHMLR